MREPVDHRPNLPDLIQVIFIGLIMGALLILQAKDDSLDRRLQAVQAQVDSIKTAYAADTLPAVKGDQK
jgi:hypothetical protein